MPERNGRRRLFTSSMFEDFRLRVFMAVAETGSFTRAAKALNVSQPAISNHISILEKEAGVQLFIRARSEAFLTDSGKAFREYVSHILYWYSAAGEMFGEKGAISSRSAVRISAAPVIASYLLPEALALISGSHPETTFRISELNRTSGGNGPDAAVPGNHFGTPQDAEVEITVAPSPETMDFEGEEKLVGVMDAVVVASPENRSVRKAAVSEDDTRMTAKPFSTIAGVPVSNRFAVWDGYRPFFTPDLVARTSLESGSIEAIKTLVRDSGSLVGIVPAISVRREIASGELLQMPVILPDYTFDIHFNPVPEFAGKTICRLLKKTLKDNV